MRRRLAIVSATAVVTFVATMLVASLLRDDEDPPVPGARALDTQELVDVATGPARELLSLVARGQRLAHHATYQQTGGARYEVWVDGPRAREVMTPASGRRRSVLRIDDEDVHCVEASRGWSCREAGGAGIGVRARLEQLTFDLAGVDVTTRDEAIAGHAARCFTAAGAEARAEICLTRDGALARLGVDDQRLQLTDLGYEVDDEVFRRPPAARTGAAGTSRASGVVPR